MNNTETENEFERLIALASKQSLVREREFILSLGAPQETVNSLVPLASCL